MTENPCFTAIPACDDDIRHQAMSRYTRVYPGLKYLFI
jgi:hypothetical protein